MPVINENDTVSIAELKLGDNDMLSAQVAAMVHADLLLLLTDTDGLYTADPRTDPDAKHIPFVEEGDAGDRGPAHGAGLRQRHGGMATKVEGAKLAAGAGRQRRHLPLARAGRDSEGHSRHGEGHVFQGRQRHEDPPAVDGLLRADARQRVYRLRRGGGAPATGAGASCPRAVRAVEGDFAVGDVVKVYKSGTDSCLGRGTVNYSSAELREIMGLPSSKAAARYPGRPPEVIHQDNYAHFETEVSE